MYTPGTFFNLLLLLFFTVNPASWALSKPLPLAREGLRRVTGVTVEEAGE